MRTYIKKIDVGSQNLAFLKLRHQFILKDMLKFHLNSLILRLKPYCLIDFVSLYLKLHNRYCHNPGLHIKSAIKILCVQQLSNNKQLNHLS